MLMFLIKKIKEMAKYLYIDWFIDLFTQKYIFFESLIKFPNSFLVSGCFALIGKTLSCLQNVIKGQLYD